MSEKIDLNAVKAVNEEIAASSKDSVIEIRPLVLKQYNIILSALKLNNIKMTDSDFKEALNYYKASCDKAINLNVYTKKQKLRTVARLYFNTKALKKSEKFVRGIFKEVKRKLTLLKMISKTVPKKREFKNKLKFLIMSPEHGNLGDHAIAKAEEKLLNDSVLIEITESQLSKLMKNGKITFLLKILLGKNDILINGGGSVGTLWPLTDDAIMNIIEHQKKNRIFIMPQTIYYSDDEEGRAWAEKAKRIYNSHPALTVFAREQVSYDLFKPIFPNTYLVPDVVLSLNEYKEDSKRDGIALCLRNDLEKTMSDDKRQAIESFANDNAKRVVMADMHLSVGVLKNERQARLDEQFDKFRGAEFAITDRLHGMIFACITGTPCAVFNSQSHKVKGIYDAFLKDFKYIKFVKNIDELESFYNEVKGKKFVYDNSKIMPLYDKLLEKLK